MENTEAEESDTEENETEESDCFEECNEMLRIAPISHVKVTNFNYEHRSDTSFYCLYTPGHPVTRRLF